MTATTDINALLSGNLGDLVNQDLLTFTEENADKLNKARLVQGNPEFEKQSQFNTTVNYLGGIGLSVENLPEEILKKGTVMTLDSGDWAVFPELDIVVLASARVRRFFAKVDGANKLMCGTNQDGQGAKGWRGVACKNCEYHKKNFQGDTKKDPYCQAGVVALIYIPELNHAAILDLKGGSYMAATNWLSQIAELSKKFAQRPEVQKNNPGLPRVNSYFFHTRLKAGAFKTSDDGNKFQELVYAVAGAPYKWEELLNSPDVIKRAGDILKEMEDPWKHFYVDHNANAVMSLPSADAVAAQIAGAPVAALTGGTESPAAASVEKVVITEATAASAPPVATAIQLDDVPAAAEEEERFDGF